MMYLYIPSALATASPPISDVKTSTVIQATPSTLPRVLASVRGGEEIKLAAGNYGIVSIIGRRFQRAVRITAHDARLSGLTIRSSQGITWNGGFLEAPRIQNNGVLVDFASYVAITGLRVTGPRIGLSIARSNHIDATGNTFDGVRSDGINIAMSQFVNIIGNACLNFRPIRAIYGSNGRLITDGDHSDCIQGWSRKNSRPTSDVLIENNLAAGEMQGISFFDAGQGGYDRITIKNNDLTLEYWNGIVVYEGRSTIITANSVRPVPGARTRNWPFQIVTPWIKTFLGRREVVCGNVVASFPNGPGTARC